MTDFTIVTDSSCDLPPNVADELGLLVLPMHFRLRGKEYASYLDGRQLSNREFFDAIRRGETCTTSAINIDSFFQCFESLLQQGQDVLCITLSSALSSTYFSAQTAAKELADRYPDRTISIIDSRCASLGQGLLLHYAAQKQREGLGIQRVSKWLEENKGLVCHWFSLDDLNHLKRGGRISPATALLGSLMGIKPILHVDTEGKLSPVGKVKGKKAARATLVKHMMETIVNPQDQVVFLCHGDCPDDAEALAHLVREKTGAKKIMTHRIGPVIGAHSGPGTIALFFLGTHR